MTKEELLSTYFKSYVAPDGGGKLTPDDKHAPFGWLDKDTTNNENPILFQVQAALEFIKVLPLSYSAFRDIFETHMKSTEIESGLHSRRCGDQAYINQSHDNIVAAMIGAWNYKSIYAEKIFQYGSSHSWCFNVQRPNVYDIKYALQGGDIAICHYATGRSPPIWDTLWLGAGLMASSVYNLADLRIGFIREILDTLGPLEQSILKPAIMIHELKRGKRLDWITKYYIGAHPFRLLVENGLV